MPNYSEDLNQLRSDGGIITKDKSLLSQYTNSTVSDYMGYGSYSGADINVIVH